VLITGGLSFLDPVATPTVEIYDDCRVASDHAGKEERHCR
jgi:hypothetical protein